MNVVCLLHHVFKIVLGQDHTCDSGAYVGREVALPQRTNHSMTAPAVEIILTYVAERRFKYAIAYLAPFFVLATFSTWALMMLTVDVNDMEGEKLE